MDIFEADELNMVVSKKKVKDKVAENSVNYGDLVGKIPGIEFMTVLEVLNVVSCDAKIAIYEGLLECKLVDPSHVSMVHVNYGAQPLHNLGKAQRADIDVDTLLKLMKKAKWGKTTGRGDAKTYAEMLDIHINVEKISNDGTKAQLTILNESEDKKKVVRYNLMSNVNSWPNTPQMSLPAKVTLSGEDFLNKVELCKSVGDLMRIEIEDGKLITSTVLGEYENSTSVSTELINETAKHENGRSTAQYSLSYLHGIAKALKKQQITIETGDNYPIRITVDWDFGYESERKLNVQFFLAPRVESDY